MEATVLNARHMTTVFRTVDGGELTAIEDVDLAVPEGRTLALVGESGSGKSVASLSLLGLLPRGVGRLAAGTVAFAPPGQPACDLAALDPEALRQVRGAAIGIVFQEPMTSLNPVFTVGDQVGEPLRIHRGASRREAIEEAVRLLDQVGIPDPARRARQYPHELSGGMRQRVTIAMALACSPALLIADEPTTALDVTIQAQILDLLQRLQGERGMGMLFVTHNLGVVAELADWVTVMYAGRVVESAPVGEIFRAPRHPYTVGLMSAMPRLGAASAMRRAGRALPTVPGIVPSIASRPSGCPFRTRCPLAVAACAAALPALEEVGDAHLSRCLRWRDLPA